MGCNLFYRLQSSRLKAELQTLSHLPFSLSPYLSIFFTPFHVEQSASAFTWYFGCDNFRGVINFHFIASRLEIWEKS
ncbi:MAG: hypothetical protein J2P52_00475, partial [Blastocatellia bacterium]|nr:hypothetical protein [Blastocatellia bacterium]